MADRERVTAIALVDWLTKQNNGEEINYNDMDQMQNALAEAINLNFTDLTKLLSGETSLGNASRLDGAELERSTDPATLSNDDEKIPSSKVVKIYVDALATAITEALGLKQNKASGAATGTMTVQNITMAAAFTFLTSLIKLRDGGKISSEDGTYYMQIINEASKKTVKFLAEVFNVAVETANFDITSIFSVNSSESGSVFRVTLNGKIFEMKGDGTFTFDGSPIITEETLDPIQKTVLGSLDVFIVSYTGKDGEQLVIDENAGGVGVPGIVSAIPNNNTNTGIVQGMIPTVNLGDDTKIDISAGIYNIVTLSNPQRPRTIRIIFGGVVGLAVPTIGDEVASFVGIDIVGTYLFQITQFSNEQRRDIAAIGVANHDNKVNIQNTRTDRVVSGNNPLLQALDLIGYAQKSTNGNIVSPNGVNLKVDVSAGTFVQPGINFANNLKNPNEMSWPSTSPTTYGRAYRDGAGGITIQPAATEDLTPTVYDDNSGTPAVVGGSPLQATNMFVYKSGATGAVFITLGQIIYSSVLGAQNAVVDGSDRPQDYPSAILSLVTLIGAISVKITAIDLTDPTDAIFTNIKESSVGSSGSDPVVDTQVIITDAQILLLGATQAAVNINYEGRLVSIEAIVIDHESRISAIEQWKGATEEKEFDGAIGTFDEDSSENPVVINGSNNILPTKNSRGNTLSQLVVDGNKETSITGNNTGRLIGNLIDGTWQINPSYTALEQTFNLVSGNKYLIIVRTSSGVIGDKVAFAYSDATYTTSGTVIGAGLNYVAYVLTANKTLLANIKLYESETVGLFTRDYQMLIGITDTNLDGLTIEQINDIIYKYIEHGLWNVGSPKEFNQLLDNENGLAAYELTGNTIIENDIFDGLAYAKFVANGVDNRLIQSGLDLEVSSVYTAIIHVPDNSLEIQGIVVGGTSGDDFVETHVITPGDKGVFKFLMTTNATIVNGSTFIIINSVTNVSGEAHLRAVLLKGDRRDISDKEALEISKNETGGPFTRQGVTNKTIGKNKVNTDNLTNQTINDAGVVSDSSTIVRDNNLTPIFRGTATRYVYSVSGLQVGGEDVVPNRFVEYDVNFNFIRRASVSLSNPSLYNPNEDAYYFEVYYRTVSLATMTPEDVRNAFPMVELKSAVPATTYEEYKELLSYNPTEKAGFSGIYDDDDTQRFGIDRNDVLKDTVSWGITSVLTNTHEFFVALELLGYKKPATSIIVPIMKVIIGGVIFTIKSQTDISNLDEENIAGLNTTGNFLIRVDKVTYPDSATWEAHLQSSDVVFIYELETYLDREVALINESKWQGQLLVTQGGTYEQSSPQGVIGSFTLENGPEFKDEAQVIRDSLYKLNKDMVDAQFDIIQLFKDLGVLEDDILYINPAPLTHINGDIYQFRQPVEDNETLEIWFEVITTGLLFSKSAIFKAGEDMHYCVCTTGTNSAKKEVYFDASGNTTSEYGILQPYEATINNAAVSGIVTADIKIYAILKKGGFKL